MRTRGWKEEGEGMGWDEKKKEVRKEAAKGGRG